MLNKTNETVLAPEAYWCNPKCDCGIFPGICVTPSGEITMLMVSGSEFESADQRIVSYTGSADGSTWAINGDWGDIYSNGLLFDVCVKPTQLPDGSIAAIGYGYERDIPELSLSLYAEKYGHFPRVRNFVTFSNDNGKTYSGLNFIESPRGGIEFSGPAIVLPNGNLLAFGPPFNVDADGQIGLCYESTDNGKNWHEKSVYFKGGNITSWETRAMLLPDGRIAVIFWAFDLTKQAHLPNKIALSSDNGSTWTVIDTQIPGQAANLTILPDGSPAVLYAKREGDDPGIYLQKISLDNNQCTLFEKQLLYDASSSANVKGNILQQFYNLKFGQPSITRLKDGSYLLVFWRKNASGIYEVPAIRFA